MKNYLKLINDERQDSNKLSRKACTYIDLCDTDPPCTYVDVCTCDSYSDVICRLQYDVCDIDVCAVDTKK